MYPHCNPGMELVLVEQGHLEWGVDRVPEVLNSGSIFFTLPWQVHGSSLLREPPNRICYILFDVEDPQAKAEQALIFPEWLGMSADEERTLSTIFKGATQHGWTASPLIKQLFPELLKRLDGSGNLDQSIAGSLLRSLLLELGDIVSCPLGQEPAQSSVVRRVDDVLAEVRDQLDQPWSLDGLAATCGLKRSQFSKIVSQLTGYAPLQYIGRLRFETACELLRNSSKSITEIAFESGYSSSQYFAERFKAYARITPTEYRNYVPELDTIMENNWDHPEWRTVEQEQQRAVRLRKNP